MHPLAGGVQMRMRTHIVRRAKTGIGLGGVTPPPPLSLHAPPATPVKVSGLPSASRYLISVHCAFLTL